MDTTSCLNCDTPVTGPFCAACGQDHAQAASLSAGVTFFDVLDAVVQVNGALARAAVDLVLRPGVLTADYLAGRRARHPPPAKLYLVVNFVFFVAVQWFDPVPAETIAGLVGPGAYTAAERASGLAPALFAAGVEQRMGEALPTFLVLFVPAVAIVLRGLYPSRPLGVVGHAVFGFHLMAFLLLAFLPGTILAGPTGDVLISAALYAALPLWTAVALRRAYGGSVGWTVMRAGALWLVVVLLLAGYFAVLAAYAV
ncbi:MAG TPA: DUF3667 domain-containing protein [Rubricoccaceae bacterium]|jgi:hypothetical protein